MRIRAEFEVEKADGRRERLRAAKLGRSILLALGGDAADAAPAALDLAGAILSGVRAATRGDCPLSSAAIAEGVVRALLAADLEAAARRYVDAALASRRRRVALRDAGIGGGPSRAVAPMALAPGRRGSGAT